MKHLIYAIIIFVLTISSCTSPAEGDLMRAEMLIDSIPERSLEILDSIDEKDLNTSHSRALYCLLKTQALDKTTDDFSYDSICKVAVNYFAENTDTYHKILAYFYSGKVLFHKNKYAESVCDFLKAYDLAKSTGNYFWQARAASEASIVFDKNHHGKEAISYAKAAYNLMKQSKRQPFIDYEILNLGRIFLNNRKYDDCIIFTKECLDSAIIHSDDYLKNCATLILAKAYYSIEQYKDAIDYFTTLTEPECLDNSTDVLLGISYLETGNRAKADSIYSKYNGNHHKIAGFISSYERRVGNYKVAYEMLGHEYKQLDSALIASMNQNFSGALNDLRVEDLNKIETTHKKQNFKIYVVGILIIFTLITALIIYFRKLHKNKLKLEQNIVLAEELRELLDIKETEYTVAKSEIQNLLANQYIAIDEICKSIYESPSNKAKQSISDSVENLLKTLSTRSDKVLELEEKVDHTTNGLISELKKSVPGLRDYEELIFLYSTLNFSVPAMVLLCGEGNINALYNRKSRLRKKIIASDSNRKDELLSKL